MENRRNFSSFPPYFVICCKFLIVLGYNMSTLKGQFVLSPREREKSDRRDSKDERERQGRKMKMNEIVETEEIKTFPLYPYPAARIAGLALL